jgi:hypothetical protein
MMIITASAARADHRSGVSGESMLHLNGWTPSRPPRATRPGRPCRRQGAAKVGVVLILILCSTAVMAFVAVGVAWWWA